MHLILVIRVSTRKVRILWNYWYIFQIPDMRKYPKIFKENFHMVPSEFDQLLCLVEEKLQPKINSRPTDSISANEKLCITIEFLASGTLQRHLASIYRVSKQHVGTIIDDTCSYIIEALSHLFIQEFTPEKWIEIANEFHRKWNFPNCLGAFDGKHCGIKCPKNSSSCFYNYKGFFSIVLMAVADANYRFIYTDIGSYGSEWDSAVFRNCEFGKALFQNQLNIPAEQKINGKSIPFTFISDDAFPLHRNIMKPFKPIRKGQPLTNEERVYNYRLSRARRVVENAFGILCARWICLARTMFVKPDRAQKIVAACCSLHNYLLKESRNDYCPPGFDDSYDEQGNLVEGNWRKIIPPTSLMNSSISAQIGGRPPKNAVEIREHMKDYFNSPSGSVAWQAKAVFIE